jgi:hypothetical protein
MIAISYRRQDSNPVAGRLYDRLQAEFGKGAVFMDFDSIPYGVDFREHIKHTLRRAKVIVAIIGPDWAGAKDKSDRRIDDPTDFVRLEIASALESDIPIIPVLINNTPMPDAKSLPPELEALAFRNGLALDTGIDFHHHADRLIAGIHKVVDAHLPPSSVLPPAPAPTAGSGKNPVIIGVLALVALLAGIGGWYLLGHSANKTTSQRETVEPIRKPDVVLQPPVTKEPAKNLPASLATTPLPTASIAVTSSDTNTKPAETPSVTSPPSSTLSTSPSSASGPEEANVPGREYTFTGKIGFSDAVFHLRFESGERVSGNYTQKGSTYRLEGTHHPKNKLALSEYTGDKLTARLDLTRTILSDVIRWEGTMRNTPPDNRTFPVSFERPYANTTVTAPTAPPTSNPAGGNETVGDYTYSGKVGATDAIFRLKFEGAEHVAGNYTQKGVTYRLEGRHPKGKLLLDEYTQDRVTAHLNLTRDESASDIRWEGTMHNTPPDNRVFKVFFSRPRQ